MKRILILASNPRKDLNLDREIRDLKAAIARSNSRDQFEVVDELAVQVEDLQDHLLRHRPHIVHFCGHGSGEQGLVFEGESGSERWVRTDALSNLFRLFEQDVKCVLLNACYSEEQADAIRAEYKEMLLRLIEEGYYPFDDTTQRELQQLSQELELTEQEITTIAHPILEAAEADYQQRLAQERHQQQIAEQQQRQRAQELERQREQQRQREIEQQQQEAERRRQAEAKAKSIIEDLGNGVTLEMVKIPGGTFLMGSPAGEEGRLDREGPQHLVTIQPFLIGKFAVTQAQWRSVAGLPKVNRDLDPNPSHFKGANRPVEQVSWEEAVEFCERLSRKTGKQYRLPSEAEWEYACRAGTTTPFHFGETITIDLANYDGSYTYGSGPKGQYREQTTDVGSFPPNAFSLYDMHGNVWEWCADRWHENYQGAPTDGSAWMTGDSKYWLMRGGSWFSNPRYCRSAVRNRDDAVNRNDFISFRVACSLSCTLLRQN